MKALKPDTLTRLLPAMNYRSGDRRGADPGAPSNFFMVQASEVTDPEIEQAAAHFSKLPVKSFVKVVETAVPIVRALHARSFAELARDDAAPEQIAAHVALILDDSYRHELLSNNLLAAEGRNGRILGTVGPWRIIYNGC